MQLIEMRNEVLARGFDPIAFISRITMFLNDAQSTIARRVNYYVSEATQTITTSSGTSLYAFPTDFARAREVRDTDLQTTLSQVTLKDIDQSSTSSGTPRYYAIDGANTHLYPTPDGVHNLALRYWKMPTALVNDTDVPSIPADYHSMLIDYATARCYEVDDDPQMGGYWRGIWEKELSQFSADQKYPDTEQPNQVRGMWQEDAGLSEAGWTRAGF